MHVHIILVAHRYIHTAITHHWVGGASIWVNASQQNTALSLSSHKTSRMFQHPLIRADPAPFKDPQEYLMACEHYVQNRTYPLY
jgi:hypothetical protein